MLDKKYDFKAVEEKWQKFWQENGTYKFDRNSKKETFSIDTPPPTVSGELHIGHIAGFNQFDMFARYQRMLGKNVFYPLGFDNNGLPTELLVEKKKGVRAHTMPREDFTKMALSLVDEYNQNYRETMIKAGMSFDMSLGFNTIDARSQKTSQKSFIDLAKRGIAYRSDKPSPWCTKCRTSVATAELEDSDLDSVFNYLNFKLADGSGVIPIATTRPEFLPACGAIFVNPDDARYSAMVGKKVLVPLFGGEVTVLTDSKVGVDKGTGAVMCCTFGDQTDVEWWREYNLPLKQAIDDGGRMTELAGKYAGLKSTEARKAIIEDLKAEGYLYKQDAITHAVKVHERCGEPIEFMAKKQWFIKTSTPELKQIWLERGNELNWHPASMKARFDAWVTNLNQDWSISRQRYFGVPFPVWYCKKCGEPVFAREEDLPINPISHKAPIDKCPKCGHDEFEPEMDVLDTWATSSVTPQINCNWAEDEEGCAKKMPMSLRPCGRDIINTWCLRTIIKAHYHQNTLPWKNLMVNGWVMADKGIKISKHLANSKMGLKEVLNSFGADVVRYWSANGAYGRDVFFSDDGIKDGAKLQNKIWNASKFVLSFLYDWTPEKPKTILPMDLYIMQKFNDAFDKTMAQYENYEMGYAKAEIEKFFWSFCDNYIEIAKNRLYKPEVYGEDAKRSAQWACFNVLFGLLQVLSITMPHITEEIYQDYFRQFKGYQSINNSVLSKIALDGENSVLNAGDEMVEIVSRVRAFKSENQISLKTQIADAEVTTNYPEFMQGVLYDLKAVNSIGGFNFKKGDLNIKFGEIIPD